MPLTESLERIPKATLIPRLVRSEISSLVRKLVRAFGYRRPRTIPLDEIKIPDSDLAIKATQLVEQCSPPFLLNHSLRTYCFGVAIAKHLRLKPDLEVFYLAAIMHDLGLVPPYDRQQDSFEITGAVAARQFIIAQGEPTSKADLIHEAIALHSSVGIAHKREPEIALLHYGAGVDVIGFHNEDIAPNTLRDIVSSHPRLDFKEAFIRLLEEQVILKPQCHIAGPLALGFDDKIRKAPFTESHSKANKSGE